MSDYFTRTNGGLSRFEVQWTTGAVIFGAVAFLPLSTLAVAVTGYYFVGAAVLLVTLLGPMSLVGLISSIARRH